MGMQAVHDMVRIVELTEQVAAALLIGVRQALELRARARLKQPEFKLSVQVQKFVEDLQKEIAFVEEDVELDSTLRQLSHRSKMREWHIQFGV